MSVKVCHISSVHASGDPRVRLKQLQSVSKIYPDTTFVTGDLNARRISGDVDSFRLIRIWPGHKKRILRLILTGPFCIVRAAFVGADVYHLHDPELLLWSWILRLKGAAVVYDIHEDYVSSIYQKRYIPHFLRRVVASIFENLEGCLSSYCYRVIAERYYFRRFPDSVYVLNYPVLSDLLPVSAFSCNSKKVIYTGNVTPDRGALAMSNFHFYSKKYDVNAFGYCAEGIYRELERQDTGQAKKNLMNVEGVGFFLEYFKILEAYKTGGWLAGIALFPETGHYREKELTKFFEYMAVGLPIVASDFPVWRELIEEQGVGICVDPGDNEAIEGALDWLYAHPEEAAEMGRQGKRLASEKYSWDSQARNLIGLYEEIMKKTSS